MKYFTNNKRERGFIVSPEYGCGWYTHNGKKYPECATDPELVELVIEYQSLVADSKEPFIAPDALEIVKKNVEFLKTRIQQYASFLWKDGYWNADGLRVQWAAENSIVRYSEHDGAESVTVQRMFDSDSLVIT